MRDRDRRGELPRFKAAIARCDRGDLREFSNEADRAYPDVGHGGGAVLPRLRPDRGTAVTGGARQESRSRAPGGAGGRPATERKRSSGHGGRSGEYLPRAGHVSRAQAGTAARRRWTARPKSGGLGSGTVGPGFGPTRAGSASARRGRAAGWRL